MKIIHGLKGIAKIKRPVVALGVFDGVHLGHRNILKAAAAKARSINGTSVVLTFWPHPRAKKSLYSLEHRFRLIAAAGIDLCLVANFSRHFSEMTARDFIERILIGLLKVNYIYIGENFHFGRSAKGNWQFLDKFSRSGKFRLKVFKVVKINQAVISSTSIRRLITGGRLRRARELLGRPVSILGTVIRGSTLGRMLGFPTANINPHHEVIPACGIYAVKIILGKDKFQGICYIGSRPTLKGDKKINIEAHIFNFHKDIYGKILELQFIKKIRSDKKFPDLKALAAQIKKDIAIAKAIHYQAH